MIPTDKPPLTQPQKIDAIIDGSCAYFGIKKEKLIGSYGTRNNIHKYRRYIAFVLSERVELPMADIAQVLGFWDKNRVSLALTRMRDELSTEFFSLKKTKEVYGDLVKYLDYENIHRH